MASISLTIDGRTVEVEEGTTVLQAARKAGITIPTVCDHKDLNPYGSCRMCIVEIENVRGFPTSCTTPATNGMQVTTQSERLTTLRNRTLELMFSGHPNSCLVCPHREACETYRPTVTKAARSTRCGFCANREGCDLRHLALSAGPRELNLPTFHGAYKLERDDPFMDRDYNLCVLCGRCWRICEKIHGKPAISIINRGKWARIGTAFDASHVLSGCTFCGACIDICPTGTLTDRFARWQGKPQQEPASTCILCPEGCSVIARVKDQQLLSYNMPAFTREDGLCALGRFVAAQLVANTRRLIRPQIREGGDLIPVDWEQALQTAAAGLKDCKGAVAFVISATSTREERFLYGALCKQLQGRLLLLPALADKNAAELSDLAGLSRQGNLRGVVTNGDLLSGELLATTPFALVIDSLHSRTADQATVVLPASLLSETDGTFRNAKGVIKTLAASTRTPGQARVEWRILQSLIQQLGGACAGASVNDLTSQINDDPAPAPLKGEPRQNVRDIPVRYRGHLLADFVPGLHAFGLPTTRTTADKEPDSEGCEILEKREIVANFHFFRIKAPQVAKFALPGQFVILMARETSERSPFTLIDWDADSGSISLVIEEVGRSSRELASLRTGDRIAHVSGPLGLPLPIEQHGTILLGGGCYGIGAIYPLARALRQAGNWVICAIEASSSHLLYMEEELAGVCDQLIVATKDGSRGMRGGVQEVIEAVRAKETIDQCIAIGCTFMMRMVTALTKTMQIPTLVALNPIMVDGTGMCGACRVSVDNATKFACVDGPIFDGHAVDWDELASRRSAYAREEIQALPQEPDLSALMYRPQGHVCGCGR
ncbi:MAG: sulfide/dihydroorotate dehydrogenase-like FAD/NAD-binding protein [Desulfobulbus sp.]|jgi:NAD(P)H-flavin reductase/ferredoxin